MQRFFLLNQATLRRFWLAAFLLLAGIAPSFAQGGDNSRSEKLESARIAYITDKISLTQDQAQRFWPLYNEFTAKRRELHQQGRQRMRDRDFSAMSEREIRGIINNEFARRQNELNLEKEYMERLEKVISIRQVAQLMQAERTFTKALIQRLDDKPSPPQVRGQ
jgi:hypothetical protein